MEILEEIDEENGSIIDYTFDDEFEIIGVRIERVNTRPTFKNNVGMYNTRTFILPVLEIWENGNLISEEYSAEDMQTIEIIRNSSPENRSHWSAEWEWVESESGRTYYKIYDGWYDDRGDVDYEWESHDNLKIVNSKIVNAKRCNHHTPPCY